SRRRTNYLSAHNCPRVAQPIPERRGRMWQMNVVRTLGGAVLGVSVLVPVGSDDLSAQALVGRQGNVTFTKDVAPILQRSCQTCHRPESMAPMSLMTYEDARPWVRSIKRRVVAREMPP